MAYTTWSVVAYEQPTAAKWNQLGENDAGFRDGTNIDNDAILARHIDWASKGANAGIWWEELGRVTLTPAGDAISLTSLPARKFLRVLLNPLNSGQLNWGFRFNNDSGTNYAMNYSVNYGAQTLAGSSNNLFAGSIGSANYLTTLDIVNIANQSKIVHIHTGDNGGNNSAGTAGNAFDGIGKWTNTSNQITRIDAFNIGTGDFQVNSELVVLGHD